jgi:hypothetical protein
MHTKISASSQAEYLRTVDVRGVRAMFVRVVEDVKPLLVLPGKCRPARCTQGLVLLVKQSTCAR